MVVTGEDSVVYPEIKLAVDNNIPIIVVDGTKFCKSLISWLRGKEETPYCKIIFVF